MIVAAIDEAQRSGARLANACEVLGISARTVERWRREPHGEGKRQGPRPRPANALSPFEEARVRAVMRDPKHAGMSPKQLVPQLADEGVYLASESTLYRLRRAARPARARPDAR